MACPGWAGWKDVTMARPYPKEFRDDVVRVAGNHEDGVTIEQIAADFGVHPMTLSKWLRQAGSTRGPHRARRPESRPSCRSCVAGTVCWSRRMRCCVGRRRICRSPTCREKALPARERARRRHPVAVTCRVRKLARQPYYRWLANPVTDAETG